MVNSVAISGDILYAAQGSKVYKILYDKNSSEIFKILLNKEISLTHLGLSEDCKYLIGIGDVDKTVIVVDAETLEVAYTHKFPKRPSAWSTCKGNLVVADKFGDVFSVKLTEPLSDEARKNMEPILGHVSMILDVVATENNVLTSDRDEHIRVCEYPNSFVIERFLLGSRSYIAHLGVSGNYLLSAGGDPVIYSWNWKTGKEISNFNLREYLKLDNDDIDVISVSVTEKEAWVAVQGQPKVIKFTFPELQIVDVFETPHIINSLANNGTDCFAACPKGLIKVYKSASLSPYLELDGPEDILSQTHLRKAPRN